MRADVDNRRARRERRACICGWYGNAYFLTHVNDAAGGRNDNLAVHISSKIKPLILCTYCRSEMRLFGIESEGQDRDLYSFECQSCGDIEVRTALASSPVLLFKISK